MGMFKDTYKISKLYINFPRQGIFLEISNKDVLQIYFRQAQTDIREKMARFVMGIL